MQLNQKRLFKDLLIKLKSHDDNFKSIIFFQSPSVISGAFLSRKYGLTADGVGRWAYCDYC